MLHKNHAVESSNFPDPSPIIEYCARHDKQFSVDDGNQKLPRLSNCVDRCLFMSNQGSLQDKEIFKRGDKLVDINFKDLSKTLVISPESYEMPFEFLKIKTVDEVELVAFLVRQTTTDAHKIPTIILFHGNAGNIGHALPIVSVLFEDLRCNIFAVEYRGFGFSAGFPTERGVYLDAQAALDYVASRRDLDPTKIVLHGFSIGGSVAIDLATRPEYKGKVAALVVENTFACLSAMIKDITARTAWLRPLNKCVRSFCQLARKFPNYQKISLVECPVLFLSATKDRLIHPRHMAALYTACKVSKEIAHFPEGHHTDLYTFDQYTRVYNTFIQKTFDMDLPVTRDSSRVSGMGTSDPSFFSFLQHVMNKGRQDSNSSKRRGRSRITFGVAAAPHVHSHARTQDLSQMSHEDVRNYERQASRSAPYSTNNRDEEPGPSGVNPRHKTIVYASPFKIGWQKAGRRSI